MQQRAPWQLTEEEEAQHFLEVLNFQSDKCDRIRSLLVEVELAYNQAYNWLILHGLRPTYDREKRRFVAEPISSQTAKEGGNATTA